jgi:hypothetical protein
MIYLQLHASSMYGMHCGMPGAAMSSWLCTQCCYVTSFRRNALLTCRDIADIADIADIVDIVDIADIADIVDIADIADIVDL